MTATQDTPAGKVGRVEFYVGTDAGVLERQAAHTTDVPDISGPSGATRSLIPFVEIVGGANAEQVVEINVSYGVFLR